MALGVWLGAVWGLLLLSGALAQERKPPRMVGAPMEASMDEEQAQRALRFAVERYNRGTNDAFSSRVAEVISVRKQIVAGIKYIFTVKVGRTACRKSEIASSGNSETCAFMTEPGQAKESVCNFTVFIVPWANQIELSKNVCQ
ncbi:cystatin-like [Eublepharis macularius]|uniref:Cystatin-like n=1 Tax=Eublepharis macularius TaxID=481883 RepID=A0AA97JRK1_EUBMA|nr:cystatin-like [Eublepharis macularius]